MSWPLCARDPGLSGHVPSETQLLDHVPRDPRLLGDVPSKTHLLDHVPSDPGL